jgi:flagellar biosynthesis protein FliQ
MIEEFKNIVWEAELRLHHQMTAYLPSLLAAAVIVIGAYITALLARWIIYKIFKGLTVDKFLRESGVAYILAPSGRLQATRIFAETAFWCILLIGLLLGLSIFNTTFTTQMDQAIVSFLPKLFEAGLILLGGSWLSRYLGRGALVWAVNERLPSPHRLAAAVRTLVMFAAVVVAADQLHFASGVFLAAFIIIVGGTVIAVGIAIGLGNYHFFEEKKHQSEDSAERSLWSHL